MELALIRFLPGLLLPREADESRPRSLLFELHRSGPACLCRRILDSLATQANR